jgi:hypothetical protein
MISLCHAVSCAVVLADDVSAPRRFCPVHWCTIPTALRSALRTPLFDALSVSGRLALARARLAIAELEGRSSALPWLSGAVTALERISSPEASVAYHP